MGAGIVRISTSLLPIIGLITLSIHHHFHTLINIFNLLSIVLFIRLPFHIRMLISFNLKSHLYLSIIVFYTFSISSFLNVYFPPCTPAKKSFYDVVFLPPARMALGPKMTLVNFWFQHLYHPYTSRRIF